MALRKKTYDWFKTPTHELHHFYNFSRKKKATHFSIRILVSIQWIRKNRSLPLGFFVQIYLLRSIKKKRSRFIASALRFSRFVYFYRSSTLLEILEKTHHTKKTSKPFKLQQLTYHHIQSKLNINIDKTPHFNYTTFQRKRDTVTHNVVLKDTSNHIANATRKQVSFDGIYIKTRQLYVVIYHQC